MRRKRTPTDSVLNRELEALRAEKGSNHGSFSGPVRSELVEAAHRAVAEKPGELRAWIWTLAGAAAAIGVLALWIGRPQTPLEMADLGSTPRIEVEKRGDHVVFNLENGQRVHTVSASENPQDFRTVPREEVKGGSFIDRLDRGPQLVFYRID